MKTKKLNNLLLACGEYGLSLQAADGAMPAGHNGPYHHPETPVRNTAHWLFLFADLYSKTGENRWKAAGEQAVRFLRSSDARPDGKTFFCRMKGADRCNGLVGQAWCIEALTRAASAFERQDCYDLAEEVFLLHPWDENTALWNRVEVDGRVMSHDGTFNHQLWFAAAAGLLSRTPHALERAGAFLDNVASRVQLYRNGLIYHSSAMGALTDHLRNGPRAFLRQTAWRARKIMARRELYSKSAGYHAFNLYAFAMLKKTFPDAKIWESKRFRTLLGAGRDERVRRDMRESAFGYRYNLSGIETACAVETFLGERDEAAAWLGRQLDQTYVSDSDWLSGGAEDPATALARSYEAARLTGDYEVRFG